MKKIIVSVFALAMVLFVGCGSTSTYEKRNTDGKGKESYNRIDVSVSASQLKNLQWIDKISADMVYRLGFIEYGELEQCLGLSHEDFNNLVDEYRSGSY